MELNALRQFMVVARLEHLSRAAEELHVAQPSLSRTIARLEAELGAALFDRAGRLQLNETGRVFRRYVERSLGELDAGRRAVLDAIAHGGGTVRLASETFLTLTGPLAAFKRSHPTVEVELHWAPADDMLRLLRTQEVELCVASQPIYAEGLVSARLFNDQVGVATGLDHPFAGRGSVTVDELAGESFISARKGHWQRRLLDRLFAERGLTPKVVCEVDELSAVADLIVAGLGIGLVPAIAQRIAAHLPLAWNPIDSSDSRRTVTLFWNADHELSDAARLMRNTITEWDWTAADPDTQRVAPPASRTQS